MLNSSFRDSGGDYGGLDQIGAVEAVSSGLIWNLLRKELTTFADGSDARQEIGVRGNTPGFH